MANTRVSDLTLGGAFAGADLLYVVETAGVGGVKKDLNQLAEFIRDTVASALVGGTDITVTVDDPGNTITVAYSGPAVPANTDDLPEGATNLYFTDARAEAAIGPVRTQLTANVTYYVATTGSDSNDGLTPGTPFATIQKAVDTIAAFDGAGVYSGTIDVADGTYAESVTLRTLVGYTQVTIDGNTTTPGNVIIDATSAGGIVAMDCAFAGQGRWRLQGMRLQSNLFGVRNANSTQFVEIDRVEFGQCSRASIFVNGAGATVRMVGDVNHISSGAQTSVREVALGGRFDGTAGTFTVSGSPALQQMDLVNQGAILNLNGRPHVISGSPSFSAAAVVCRTNASWDRVSVGATMTVTGTPTGPRFLVEKGGQIDTLGGGATFLPGNAAGTEDLASFGKYS